MHVVEEHTKNVATKSKLGSRSLNLAMHFTILLFTELDKETLCYNNKEKLIKSLSDIEL